MGWKVVVSKRVEKQIAKLRPNIRAIYDLLVLDLEKRGPVVYGWHHFGKLTTRKNKPVEYHCHLNKGTPRYVAIWRVKNNTVEIVEICYVGTHEGADY